MLDNMLFVARVTSWVARIALWLSVAGLVLMTAIIAARWSSGIC